jgi:hypothetical protein
MGPSASGTFAKRLAREGRDPDDGL